MSLPPVPKKNPVPSPATPSPALRPQAAAPRQGGGYGFLILFVIVLLVLAGLFYYFGVAPRFAAGADRRDQSVASGASGRSGAERRYGADFDTRRPRQLR